MNLIWFSAGVIIGGGIVFFLYKRSATGSKDSTAGQNDASQDSAGDVNGELSSGQQERHQKIMEVVHERGEIDNNTIEEEFGVSHATATRDLDELEKEGRIKASADAGRYVTYTRVNQ